MKQPSLPRTRIIRLKKNPLIPHIYDVEMHSIERLKTFFSIECHILLYPYSRKLSSRHIDVHPFEEYVEDISASQHSVYAPLKSFAGNLFGLFLGALISIIFLRYKPVELFSVEAIVSIFGSYVIGKEIWDDIENFLISFTEKWKIRYMGNYYFYGIEQNTILNYSSFAEQQRYGEAALLPNKLGFIQSSNAYTIRMVFTKEKLLSCQESLAHILSFHIEPPLANSFESEGFLLGVKLAFNKKFLCFTKSLEAFQFMSKGLTGCIAENGEWLNDALFYRNTLYCGRLKYFMNNGAMAGEPILDFMT